MEEAVEYLKLENSIAQNKNILYQKKLVDLEGKQEKHETEKKSIISEQEEYIKELQTIAQNRKKQESVYNTSHKSYEALQKRKDMLKDAFEKANTKDYQLQTTMQQTNISRKNSNSN
ncbi:hypothetical protein MML48_1g17894 [Holotrichia oblita]|uniref:Uncharacterized protein n=1 Tax=Holotrichia oblita TaxID=644536 RepID=A0ACB9TVG6_HOLOL|nr:hypothetical protein MML48_1g17894 [Holotrichia oblita]